MSTWNLLEIAKKKGESRGSKCDDIYLPVTEKSLNDMKNFTNLLSESQLASLKNTQYVSVKRISEKYGISRDLLYWWVRNGKIVYTKIGKKILIPEVLFLDFLINHSLDKRNINSEL